MWRRAWPWLASLAGVLALLQGCANVNTFPGVARAGDTVALMVGGSEQARRDTVSVTLTDAAGGVWDLQALGRVRSLFNVRPDGRAQGLHYSSYLDAFFSWGVAGHEPVQTVLVLDLPPGLATGPASVNVALNVSDNASGLADPVSVGLEIVPGSGSPDPIARQDPAFGPVATDFSRLEPAPHARVQFPATPALIGAASLVIDFDQTVLAGSDINLYVPQSDVRAAGGAFGTDTQRMVSWRQDGDRLYVDILSPRGIQPRYLQLFVMHPVGIPDPGFGIVSSAVYDIDGNPLAVSPALDYYPN